MSWNEFGVDPHSNFEMMLHLLHLLALIFRSNFQLIQDGCFLKGNSIIYNFFRNIESQISMESMPKMCFKLLLKIVTSIEHFWIFFFHRMYLFLYPIYFSKIFLLKQRERRSLLDRLEQIWCWFPFEILRENWR